MRGIRSRRQPPGGGPDDSRSHAREGGSARRTSTASLPSPRYCSRSRCSSARVLVSACSARACWRCSGPMRRTIFDATRFDNSSTGCGAAGSRCALTVRSFSSPRRRSSRTSDASSPRAGRTRHDGRTSRLQRTCCPGTIRRCPRPFGSGSTSSGRECTRSMRRALLRQIDAARRDGRWHDMDDCARRCLAVDPLNEEATLAHAEAIAMSGSKAKALQVIDAVPP